MSAGDRSGQNAGHRRDDERHAGQDPGLRSVPRPVPGHQFMVNPLGQRMLIDVRPPADLAEPVGGGEVDEFFKRPVSGQQERGDPDLNARTEKRVEEGGEEISNGNRLKCVAVDMKRFDLEFQKVSRRGTGA